MSTNDLLPAFKALGLPDLSLQAIQQIGYETPSPIQAQCIPLLMAGHDLVGQAQTGTGKTGAFALPLLSRVDSSSMVTQMLVLAPTRELAIQVAEACQSYAKLMKDFHVLPIYGGQSYSTQLRHLKRGVQVVVGTPGRVMDHMRRGTLKLDQLKSLVLDEADEMLRMGFIDDVEWVLEHIPSDCQKALFSATIPKQIAKVAKNYLNNPKEISIAAKTSTATTITQRYLQVTNTQKLDALTRILEVEDFEAIIAFVRTKVATVELADKLNARGYAAQALNGDIAQDRRERIISQLKAGKIDILVATDVAARGLDVERISHVINYDIPNDTEAYIHRIGRTGRAGRAGDAILFVNARELRLLKSIESATRQSIKKMQMPGTSDINETRVSRFKQKISDTINNQDLSFYQQLIHDFQKDHEVDAMAIAAALAHLVQGDQPLLLKDLPSQGSYGERATSAFGADKDQHRGHKKDRDRSSRASDRHQDRYSPSSKERSPQGFESKALSLKAYPDINMQRFLIEVGHDHQVKPGNIVGAIANEAGIDSCYIGHIDIRNSFSTVDLPADMPKDIFQSLKHVMVCQQKLNIQIFDKNTSVDNDSPRASRPEKIKKAKGKKPSGKKFEAKKFDAKKVDGKKIDAKKVDVKKEKRKPRKVKMSRTSAQP